MFRSQ